MTKPNSPSTKGPTRSAAKDRARAALSQSTPQRLGVIHEASLPYGASLCIERYRLENGLRVLLLVDKAAPVVAYHTWFRVGSRHERTGKTGLAHLLEHLMFGEFETLEAGEFDRRMEEAGAETNAATWVDWTYYYQHAPSDQLGLVIDLEAQRMGRLVLQEEPFKSELEVVANERRYRVEDDVDGAVNEQLYAAAFTKHSYQIPTIGWMADIQGLTQADCLDFYRTYYAPNNASLVIVGSFDELRTIERIASAYRYLPAAELPIEDVHPEPPQVEERRLVTHKPTDTDKIMLGYHGPALGDPDHASLSLLNDILFGGRASRVHQTLVQETEIATEVRGWLTTFQQPGLFEMQVAARPGHSASELLEALDKLIDEVVEKPVTEVELERAQARAELGLVRGLETCGGKAEQIAFFDSVLGDPCGAFHRLELLRRTSRTDLLRVARRYLNRQSRTVITVHPLEARKQESR